MPPIFTVGSAAHLELEIAQTSIYRIVEVNSDQAAPKNSLSPVGSLCKPSPVSSLPRFFSANGVGVPKPLLVNPAAVICIPPDVTLRVFPGRKPHYRLLPAPCGPCHKVTVSN